MQIRRPKFRRHDSGNSRKVTITDRDLAIISTIARYHFVPTSFLVRLVPGNEDVTHRRVRNLYDAGLVNRFNFPRTIGPPGEFHYYLDNRKSLEVLVDHAGYLPEQFDWQRLRYNREKAYAELKGSVGRFLFLEHEVMITRFHAMLELACEQSDGKYELASFRRDSDLQAKVEVPKLVYDPRRRAWYEEGSETLSHDPDAFFSLKLRGAPVEQNAVHFFYEADRKTTDTTRFRKKLRIHFHFIARQKAHREKYGINRIRAVLVETEDSHWAMQLREAARHPVVSGNRPTPLFWFTTSELFTMEHETQEEGKGVRKGPKFLLQPAVVFEPVWASPVDDQLHSLVE